MTHYIPPHNSEPIPDEHFTLTLTLDDLLHMSPVSALLRRTGKGQMQAPHTMKLGSYTYRIHPIITWHERLELIKRYALSANYVPMTITFTLVHAQQEQCTG